MDVSSYSYRDFINMTVRASHSEQGLKHNLPAPQLQSFNLKRLVSLWMQPQGVIPLARSL